MTRDMSPSSAKAMARLMRPIDRFEFDVVSGGQSVEHCLDHLARRSARARMATFNGELLAIYGVLSATALSRVGNPWLCATDLVNRRDARREFVRQTEPEMRWLCEGFDTLWNLVSDQNHVAIRWLKWIGFQFDPEPVMIRDHAFLRFSLGEHHVL